MEGLVINIREALKEDMQQIHDLIKELASFEKMEDQVQITPERLVADGFSTNPAFHCFVATLNADDTKIVGYALYFNCYSTWLGQSIFLEDIYVQPEHRRHSIGRQLFLKVAELAHNGSKRLDFHVLAWNPATEFYKSLGAINLTELEQWQMFRMNAEGLGKHFRNK